MCELFFDELNLFSLQGDKGPSGLTGEPGTAGLKVQNTTA